MSYLTSSIGRKTLMAVTGLGWSLFVLGHMVGNLLIFVGPEAYNLYSYKLINNPLLYVAEAGLVLLLLVHVAISLWLTKQNKSSRVQKYAMPTNGEKAARFASKWMIYQGSLILVFVILHLATFKYGKNYTVTYNGVEMRDIYSLVVEVFQQPGYVLWYLVALVFLGIHLSHGFYSSFASLGLIHPRYNGFLNKLGWGYAVAVTLGFISQPVYVYFFM